MNFVDSGNFFAKPIQHPYPSPEDWGNEAIYFLLPDRSSNATPDLSSDDPNSRQVFNQSDKGNALQADPNKGIDAETAAANWELAG